MPTQMHRLRHRWPSRVHWDGSDCPHGARLTRRLSGTKVKVRSSFVCSRYQCFMLQHLNLNEVCNISRELVGLERKSPLCASCGLSHCCCCGAQLPQSCCLAWRAHLCARDALHPQPQPLSEPSLPCTSTYRAEQDAEGLQNHRSVSGGIQQLHPVMQSRREVWSDADTTKEFVQHEMVCSYLSPRRRT